MAMSEPTVSSSFSVAAAREGGMSTVQIKTAKAHGGSLCGIEQQADRQSCQQAKQTKSSAQLELIDLSGGM
jgi:hypothetical protein